MGDKRFRIALSFAGEKRDFVAKVAEILAEQFGREHILYDKYHEAEFARRDLGIYLPELYHDQAEFVVVVVCPDYDQKDWTGLEWLAIHDLLKKRKDEEVMLCRFARATVKGVHSNAGWIDLDDKSPGDAELLVLERLAINEGKPKDHDLRVTWPQPLKSPIPNNLPRIQPKSDRDQLFTFVKRLPQGCKAILTSRRRIGSGSEELILEKLDQVAALATLADLARHNKLLAKTSEAERIQLYDKTGGKPLLLLWVAGQLGRGSCRPLGQALDFLATCPLSIEPTSDASSRSLAPLTRPCHPSQPAPRLGIPVFARVRGLAWVVSVSGSLAARMVGDHGVDLGLGEPLIEIGALETGQGHLGGAGQGGLFLGQELQAHARDADLR